MLVVLGELLMADVACLQSELHAVASRLQRAWPHPCVEHQPFERRAELCSCIDYERGGGLDGGDGGEIERHHRHTGGARLALNVLDRLRRLGSVPSAQDDAEALLCEK